LGNEFPVVVLDGKEKLWEGLLLFLNSVHGLFVFMIENYGVKFVIKVVGKIFCELIVKSDERRDQTSGAFEHFRPYSAF
jgi:hypothetical protein